MRYSSTHKQETRERLLNSSRAIAKKGGFDSTGVDALMGAIGLTGGAFYSHFGSKAELFAAVIEQELANSTEMLAGEETAEDHFVKRIRSYLSSSHALHPESGCALPTLGPEIARAEPAVRASVERSAKKLQASWKERLDDPDAAWALLAQCVGAILLARVVETDRTRQQILASSRRFLGRSIERLEPLGKT
ncbi:MULTISPECIES: TetR/AcrR family transcriptional regulator [Cupriavidus]|uniref:TetR/AcrR family transcriptional regulator n=1 Tax=Cupriavidus sp. DF5525 TaxID=3160989 RepID=UPI0003B01AB7|nr:TetR family transcriptional regulator [Ralstonia pickettii DTP0602]